MLTRERQRPDEGFGDTLVGVVGALDGVGHRSEKALRLPPHQCLDEVVAPWKPAICRHPRHTGPADHVFDRDALQPNSGGLGQCGVKYALAGPVGGLVDPASFTRPTDDLDELCADHDTATSGRTTPAARSCAS